MRLSFWRAPLKSILLFISLGSLAGCNVTIGTVGEPGQAMYAAPYTPTPIVTPSQTPSPSPAPPATGSPSPMVTPSENPEATPTPPLSSDYYTVTYPRAAMRGGELVPVRLSANDTLSLVVSRSAIDSGVDNPGVSMTARLSNDREIRVNVAVAFTAGTVRLTVDRNSPELLAALDIRVQL